MNRETVLTYAVIWRLVNLLSDDFAKLPFSPYRYADNGKGKEEDRAHPAYRLLRCKPNPMQTAFQWKKLMMVHALMQGNGYSYIVRDGAAKPIGLVPLFPDRTYPVRVGGQPKYFTEINLEDKAGARLELRMLEPEDVWHLKGLGYDGLQGYSVISKARENLGLGMAAEKYGSIFFRNGSKPHLALEYPARMSEQAQKNLRESWERAHSGLDQAHRVALLTEGVKLHEFGINAKDAQLLESREFSQRDACHWFKVPPAKIGIKGSVSYNSLEMEMQAYLDEGLDPWLVNAEEESDDKLLSEEEKDRISHACLFNRRKLIRANLQARGEYYTKALSSGWLNRDEIRADEDLNPIPDGKGEEFYGPLNMAPLGSAPVAPDAGVNPAPDGKVPKPAPDKDEPGPGNDNPQRSLPAPDHVVTVPQAPSFYEPPPHVIAAHRKLLTDTVGRMVRRLTQHARRAAKDPSKFLGWLDSFEAEHIHVVADALEPVLTALAAVTGREHVPADVGGMLMLTMRGELLELAGTCKALELEGRVDAFCAAMEAERPGKVAEDLLRRSKPNEPTRTTEQALELLDKLPAVDGDDNVAVLLPVDQQPDYLGKVTFADLRDKSSKEAIRISKLIATQQTCERDRLRDFIKNPERYKPRQADLPIPRDRPHVIECEGLYYVFDGHHRIIGSLLLGVSKIEVYCYKWQNEGLVETN